MIKKSKVIFKYTNKIQIDLFFVDLQYINININIKMTKFLKKFGLTTQYDEYINSDIALLPNV